MPDTEEEIAFVEAFIIPAKRERYKLLLANRKRRSEILDRLNHVLDLIPALATRVESNRLGIEGIENLLVQHGADTKEPVYILSDVRELDGLRLPLRDALNKVFQHDFGSVVCCLPGKLAYYKPESPANGSILERS